MATSEQEQSSPAVFSPPAAKPHRVLACILCQQRKVRCDRRFPCANCLKAGAQCVPAAMAPRQRRRRFPERELLERCHLYEGLLRQNNIDFESLQAPSIDKLSPNTDSRGGDSPDDAHSEGQAAGIDRAKTTVKSETVYEPKNIWHAMNQRSHYLEDGDDDDDDDDNSDPSNYVVREAVVRKVLDQQYGSNDHLLFGSRKTNVNLSTLHPGQAQIFRLWQIYLENVDPLLKVTHSPTLQARIIGAASDVANVSPTLEALMFSIYCVSVLSLAEDECYTLFRSTREDLLISYQFACQQALLNCGALRSSDHDCLTALHLYLVSCGQDTDPRSLSSMFGVAIRIAQRMGIHNDSSYAKCTTLEAEMRRRLWWSLAFFDNRICEMADLKTAMLAPTWDCRIPLNVNDCDLRPEMKTPPAVYPHGNLTEAVFAVVRSEMSEFIRHSAFHLDFVNPIFKSIAKNVQHSPVPAGGELVTLEKIIEDKYLQFCDLENPLHFMTVWTARGYLAKNGLIEYYSRYSTSSIQQTDSQRDAATSHALNMLECDTKLITSPLTKRYLWLVRFQFPFPAYIHLVHDLGRQPNGKYVEKIWKVMSDSYEARFMRLDQDNGMFFKFFSGSLIQAWEVREVLFKQLEKPLESPVIVSDIKNRIIQKKASTQNSDLGQYDNTVGMSIDDFLMPMPMNFGGGLMYGMGGHGSTDLRGEVTMNFDFNQLDWATME